MVADYGLFERDIVRLFHRVSVQGGGWGMSVDLKMAMDAVGLAAQILTPESETFAELIEAERSLHSTLHITDPTFYRKAIASEGLRQQVELSKAALAFILAVQNVKNELLP
jgi:short subunit fatty acids transporter